ncbi:MAG: DUF2924 domain-containing protein [Phenylobacterium sp.]|nr:MAG: DUF2924 domain-containing protein [Phenylobacterium sp.]
MAGALGAGRDLGRDQEGSQARRHLGEDRRGPDLPDRGRSRRVSAGDLLGGLDGLTVAELRDAWVSRLGDAPPALRTRELLSLALAYRLQARAAGDLPAASRRRMAELARRFTADRAFTPTPGPVLKPGSSIIKDWRGVRHEVRVLEDGFSYQGERFGSLSEVARRITGTKWNGHVFFGLKARSR